MLQTPNKYASHPFGSCCFHRRFFPLVMSVKVVPVPKYLWYSDEDYDRFSGRFELIDKQIEKIKDAKRCSIDAKYRSELVL